MEEVVPTFFRFEDLRVYGKAVDYCGWLHVAMREARTEGERNLINRFSNTAVSIAMNIAEGSTHSKNQFEHYLKDAKSAIRECVVMTTLSNKVGLLTAESVDQSRGYLMELTRMLGALIISLQRGSQRRNSFDDTAPSEDETDAKPQEIHDIDFSY